MSQSDLARAAVVPVASIADFEAGILALRPPDLDAIQDALERAGVELAMGETRTDYRVERREMSPGWSPAKWILALAANTLRIAL
jgi:hypothetical protein